MILLNEMEKTWLKELVEAFRALGEKPVHLSEIYNYIEANSRKPLAENWQAILRARIFEYSSDSEAYLGKENLFYSYGDLGNGMWGLREHLKK